MAGVTGRPVSLMDHGGSSHHHAHVVQVVVNSDDKGYGMKVSGDNPVYVQSVKEGTHLHFSTTKHKNTGWTSRHG